MASRGALYHAILHQAVPAGRLSGFSWIRRVRHPDQYPLEGAYPWHCNLTHDSPQISLKCESVASSLMGSVLSHVIAYQVHPLREKATYCSSTLCFRGWREGLKENFKQNQNWYKTNHSRETRNKTNLNKCDFQIYIFNLRTTGVSGPIFLGSIFRRA